MTKPILVSDLASLGGTARARKLNKKQRKEIAAAGGHASAQTRTAAERRAMALRGWARRRAREARNDNRRALARAIAHEGRRSGLPTEEIGRRLVEAGLSLDLLRGE